MALRRWLPLAVAAGVAFVAAMHPSAEAEVQQVVSNGLPEGTYKNQTKVTYENASNFLANERTYLAWIRTVCFDLCCVLLLSNTTAKTRLCVVCWCSEFAVFAEGTSNDVNRVWRRKIIGLKPRLPSYVTMVDNCSLTGDELIGYLFEHIRPHGGRSLRWLCDVALLFCDR